MYNTRRRAGTVLGYLFLHPIFSINMKIFLHIFPYQNLNKNPHKNILLFNSKTLRESPIFFQIKRFRESPMDSKIHFNIFVILIHRKVLTFSPIFFFLWSWDFFLIIYVHIYIDFRCSKTVKSSLNQLCIRCIRRRQSRLQQSCFPKLSNPDRNTHIPPYGLFL